MSAELQTLNDNLTSCQQQGIYLLSVRHHSPCCAASVAAEIERLKPSAVLIEGPIELNQLTPLLQHEECKPPVAAYTAGVAVEKTAKAQPSYSHASFYPLCDYSPEWQALQSAKWVKADIEFIDLPWADELRHNSQPSDSEDGLTDQSALSEAWLQHSKYIDALAKASGCRNQDELWDHLFEFNPQYKNEAEFFNAVASYCALAREGYSQTALELEGNIAREQHMAERIRLRRQQDAAPIVVVIGGFHTSALAALCCKPLKATETTKAAAKKPPKNAVDVHLLRYSFAQLDALNGYGAGMPTPGYYQRIWDARALDASTAKLQENGAQRRVATEILVEIARLSRERKLPTHLSSADATAAVQQCLGLASLRGHAEPAREDMLDAVRSCYVKGELSGGAGVVLPIVTELLRGNAIGDIPSGGKQPPLIKDFRAIATQCRLKLDDSLPKETKLALYRKPNHRRTSQFLHALRWLDSSFCQRLAGPDFVHGVHLDRLHEHWRYAWTPQVEAELLNAAFVGQTIEQACQYKLVQAIERLDEQGKARSMAAVTALLSQAVQMGLRDSIAQLLPLVEEHLQQDPSIESLVTGMRELQLLTQAQQTFKTPAFNTQEFDCAPHLQNAAYQRVCLLLLDAHKLEATESEACLKAVQSLAELINTTASSASAEQQYDSELFQQALLPLSQSSNNLLAGMSAGLLFQYQKITSEQLINTAIARLSASRSDVSERIGYLRGLLQVCRELIWQQSSLLAALDKQFAYLSETEFVALLPALRLTFANFTPKEVNRIGQQAARLHGSQGMGSLVNNHISEQEIISNSQLEMHLQEELIRDGLGHWIAESEPRAKDEQLSNGK